MTKTKHVRRTDRLRKLLGVPLIVGLILAASVTHPGLAAAPARSAQASAAYPLKQSANHRYLVDQNNVPFLMVGDAPHALVGNLSEADAETYLADRQAHGFNVLWVELLCKTYTGCRADGTTFDGIKPFTTPEDLATPNEAYFSRADHMIQAAALHGQVVLLDPIETGSWLATLQSNGTTKAFNYGVYLGNRYKNFANIIWMSGNDFQTWSNASDDALVTAVANGIKSVDSNHLHTVELNYLVSASLDDPNWVSIIGLNAAYTYYPTYAEVLHAYNQSASMPTFMVEAHYDGENVGGEMGTPNVLRRQEYWSMLSGAAGQMYGTQYWDFHSGWQAGIDTVGAQQLQYGTALFSSRPWYDLVPDQNHSVVTAGYGTFSTSGNVSANDYAAVARTSDGALVMAYMPTLRTLTVDMTQLSGPVTARWYDPANGTYSAIAGSPFANTGTRQFMPAGNNSVGDGDWVLVLEMPPAYQLFLPLLARLP